MPSDGASHTRLNEASYLSVKRCHGLGNVILLLPVLERLVERGVTVHLVTRPQWMRTLQKLQPNLIVSDQSQPDTIDLDAPTNSLRPQQHRSAEFAALLGVHETLSEPRLTIPAEWSDPFLHWTGAIAFAPEAGHPSRQWPTEYRNKLTRKLKGSPLVLVGTTRRPEFPCDLDTRADLELDELLGLLKVVRLVICMDSGILHLAAAVGTPTICIFGGIDPAFRIHQNQRVVALQAKLPCCPCNKNETCDERFDCIKSITVEAVLESIRDSLTTTTRVVRQV